MCCASKGFSGSKKRRTRFLRRASMLLDSQFEPTGVGDEDGIRVLRRDATRLYLRHRLYAAACAAPLLSADVALDDVDGVIGADGEQRLRILRASPDRHPRRRQIPTRMTLKTQGLSSSAASLSSRCESSSTSLQFTPACSRPPASCRARLRWSTTTRRRFSSCGDSSAISG